jgi:hypothetical protein
MRSTRPMVLGVDLHRVADLDRALEKQDQAGDEIVHDVLQAEAEAHAERAGEHRVVAQVDAHRAQRHEKADDQDGVMHHVEMA